MPRLRDLPQKQRDKLLQMGTTRLRNLIRMRRGRVGVANWGAWVLQLCTRGSVAGMFIVGKMGLIDIESV
jgi:hypothetical protein